MNVQEIALTKNAIYLKPEIGKLGDGGKMRAMSLACEMGHLGFIPSEHLWQELMLLSVEHITEIHRVVLPLLAKSKGAHVKHKPMYKGFPQEVLDLSHFELFVNAICHYWTDGAWLPDNVLYHKDMAYEHSKYITLDLFTDQHVIEYCRRLINSTQSLTPTQRDIIESVAIILPDKIWSEFVTDIPFKETLCFVAGLVFKHRMYESHFPTVSTATDVLRIITALSDGDISLGTNTKFKSLPRSYRRVLLQVLDGVINGEDVQKHKNKWIRVFHMLHVGEYEKRYPNVHRVAQRIRNGEKCVTFNSLVELAISGDEIPLAVNTLMKRPGEFARRIGHLVTLCGDDTDKSLKEVIEPFLTVADKVPSRILIPLAQYFLNRHKYPNIGRLVYPKGSVAKAQMLKTGLPQIDFPVTSTITASIAQLLMDRWEGLPDLGGVYIDPRLKRCPIPVGLRSASKGLFAVGRGTRLPLNDGHTVRLFLYWVGEDIDLSAVFWNDDFTKSTHISYTKLKGRNTGAVHSGDIIWAPDGASEFIDIPIQAVLDTGYRYVQTSLHVYAGPNFSEHKKCFMGWMVREKPGSNEIFEPKTVQQKIDLTADSRNHIPVVFDLQTREIIWTDLCHNGQTYLGGNNVESNRAALEDLLRGIANTVESKANLYQLFLMHGLVRGVQQDDKSEADTVFSIDGEGTKKGATIVTPYDIDVINSEYLV